MAKIRTAPKSSEVWTDDWLQAFELDADREGATLHFNANPGKFARGREINITMHREEVLGLAGLMFKHMTPEHRLQFLNALLKIEIKGIDK